MSAACLKPKVEAPLWSGGGLGSEDKSLWALSVGEATASHSSLCTR